MYYVYKTTDSVQETITLIRIIINRIFPFEVKHVEPLRLLQPQTVKPPFRATAITPLQCVPASKQPIPCFITQIQIGSVENMALKTIAENMIRNFNKISKSSRTTLCAIL